MINKDRINTVPELIRFLKERFDIIQDSRLQTEQKYYDTFDWRLYLKDYHLYKTDQKIELFNFMQGRLEEWQVINSDNSRLLNIDPGPVREKIDPIIEIRSLRCVASIKKVKRVFRLQNNNQKTVLRIIIEDLKIKNGPRYVSLAPIFTLKPLRGYSASLSEFVSALPEDVLIPCQDDLLKIALSVIHKTPVDYTTKMSVQLSESMTAVEAIREVYSNLWDIILINQQGIIEDIDPEFLHDFRVAVRKTRSALSQLKGIFPENIEKWAKKSFTYLGKTTNVLRDIDVYLLKKKQYQEMLPENFQSSIEPFFVDLKQRRLTEHKKVIRMLRSQKYSAIKSEWQALLNQPIKNISTSGTVSLPIINVARRVIYKRNKKVLSFGRKILRNSSDELMHQLRIEGKKLRYLLEFFNSLFPEKKIKKLLKSLKQLQDILGEFNDLSVQQDHLLEFALSRTSDNEDNIHTVLALGMLIGKLNERQVEVKKRFTAVFTSYADMPTQKIVQMLFYHSERKST